jgi:hypothetical protein
MSILPGKVANHGKKLGGFKTIAHAEQMGLGTTLHFLYAMG